MYLPHNSINKFQRVALYFLEGFIAIPIFICQYWIWQKCDFRLTYDGEYPNLLRIVWQQWKRIFRVRSSVGAHLFYFIKFEEDKQNEKAYIIDAYNRFDVNLRNRPY